MTGTVHLRPANLDDLDTVVSLFREYAGGIGIDLGYQGFEDELESLPGAYAPPRGVLVLAELAGEPVGCVAVRPLHGTDFCEMKRLYVRDSARGTGAGRALAAMAVAEGARMGYAGMRLDTLSTMRTALSLYRTLGFREIPAYYDTPVSGTVFMHKDLEK
ncbi:MAG TPA: GNAT family N-acetyltransferase [Rhizomicrobium sp.]|nr:GNAT family N-acetyltransferase [Rhizomicrobium sp.]